MSRQAAERPKVLLTSGRFWSALSMTRALGRLGYDVHVVDSSRW
jgi:hypothetical protein